MSETKTVNKAKERPLSPHLGIYRWRLTMALSIFHRATGVALAVGILMLVWMLVAAATGPEAFDYFMGFATSMIGQIMLFGWTVALFYHLCNGVRHLISDAGYLFKLKNAFMSGYIVLIATALLTAYVWCPFFRGVF